MVFSRFAQFNFNNTRPDLQNISFGLLLFLFCI